MTRDADNLYVFIDRNRDGVQDSGELFQAEVRALSWRIGIRPGDNAEDPDYTYAEIRLKGEDFYFTEGAAALVKGQLLVIHGDDTSETDLRDLDKEFTGFIDTIDYVSADEVVVTARTQMARFRFPVNIPLILNPTSDALFQAIFLAAPVMPYAPAHPDAGGVAGGELPLLGVVPLPFKLGQKYQAIIGENALPSLYFINSWLTAVQDDLGDSDVLAAYGGDWVNEDAYTLLKEIVEMRGHYFFFDRNGRTKGDISLSFDGGTDSATINDVDVMAIDGDAFADYISAVDVVFNPRVIGSAGQIIYVAETSMRVDASSKRKVIVRFRDPDLRGRPIAILDTPALTYTANTAADGSGTDVTARVRVKVWDIFGGAAEIRIVNETAATAYIIDLEITGQPLLLADDVTVRVENPTYTTLYGPRYTTVRNRIIGQFEDAVTFGESILDGTNVDAGRFRAITLRGIRLDVDIGDRFTLAMNGDQYRVLSCEYKIDHDKMVYQTILGVRSTSY